MHDELGPKAHGFLVRDREVGAILSQVRLDRPSLLPGAGQPRSCRWGGSLAWVPPRYRALIVNLSVKSEVEVEPTNSAESSFFDTVNFVNPFLGSLFAPIHLTKDRKSVV